MLPPAVLSSDPDALSALEEIAAAARDRDATPR